MKNRQATPLYNLTHDGVLILHNADEFAITRWIHINHSYSLSHAVEFEGYAVEPSNSSVSLVGRPFRCAETKQVQTVEHVGCTYNYAVSSNGEMLSDAGVDLRERRELLDRSRPFTAYVSRDGKRITGWKNNTLMHVTSSRAIRLTRWSYTHGKTIQSIQATDVHGARWYGRGNPGICITMRAYGARKVRP